MQVGGATGCRLRPILHGIRHDYLYRDVYLACGRCWSCAGARSQMLCTVQRYSTKNEGRDEYVPQKPESIQSVFLNLFSDHEKASSIPPLARHHVRCSRLSRHAFGTSSNDGIVRMTVSGRCLLLASEYAGQASAPSIHLDELVQPAMQRSGSQRARHVQLHAPGRWQHRLIAYSIVPQSDISWTRQIACLRVCSRPPLYSLFGIADGRCDIFLSPLPCKCPS